MFQGYFALCITMVTLVDEFFKEYKFLFSFDILWPWWSALYIFSFELYKVYFL